MEYLSNLLTSIKLNTVTIFGSILILLSPIKYIMMLVGFFIVLDTIFGVYVANKINVKITSRKLSRFIGKMLIYQLVIITAYALGGLLLGEFLENIFGIKLMLTKIAALMLIVNELFSIDEKIRLVNNDKGIWFYFKQLLSVTKKIKTEVDDVDIDIKPDNK